MFNNEKTNRQDPINSVSEDKLNRESFVNYVVNIISNASVIDTAFVLSINGKWGEGKTSLKNLIIENLKYRKSEKNLLLEFNSIDFQDQKEISSNFINRVVDAVKNKKSKFKPIEFINENRRIILLIALSALLVSGIFRPSFLRNTSSIIIGFFTLKKLLSLFSLKNVFLIFKRQLGKINLSSLLDVVSRSYLKADVVHKILYYDPVKNSAYNNERLRTFIETKCDYDKIVLFIDNFDLIEPNQAKLLIKLLSSTLNLPKFVFVLFYDKHLIEKYLNNEAYTGAEFLEKFVNIQLDLPLITNDVLLSFLQNELEDKYDIDIETSSKFKLVKNYFTSLNKIYSFLDTFGINYKIAVNNLKVTKDYINKEDFLYLEIIRFFENDIYREIRKGKFELTFVDKDNALKKNDLYKEDKEEFLEKLKALINISSNSENLEKLIFLLFPNMNSITEDKKTTTNENLLLFNKNIGSFEYFDYYFIYDFSENIISSANFKVMIKNVFDHKLFIGNLKEIFVINDDKLICYISNNILAKLEKEINSTIRNKNLEANNMEFMRNIIWLYSYSNKDKKINKIVVNIFLKYFCDSDSFLQFINIVELFFNEKDFNNFVYVINILNEIRLKIIKTYSENNVYKKYLTKLRKIILFNIDVLFCENYLIFLRENSYNSHSQKKFVCSYIKEFYLNYNLDDLNKNKYINFLLTSNLFKNFKDILFNKYPDILMYYLNSCIEKRTTNNVCYCLINPILIYPFNVDELLYLFKDYKFYRFNNLYKLLCKVEKFKRKYKYISNIRMIQNTKILSMLYLKCDI